MKSKCIVRINCLNELVHRLKEKNCKNNYKYNKQLRDKHEDANMTSKTQNVGEGSKKCRSLRMCLNLNDY